AWQARLALIERIGARVITDLKLGAVFPTDHALHAGAPGIWLDADANAVLRAADVILSLDWVDLGGTLKAAFDTPQPPAKVIHASLDHRLHGGWSMDYQALPPVDLLLAAEPDQVVAQLADVLQARPAVTAPDRRQFPIEAVQPGAMGVASIAH